MSKFPKISIIIPVYNVASYLNECLDSVKNQIFKDYEVIIVNDGSTDNSLNIVEERIEDFCDIKVITQNNQGLSAARNNGILAAEGDFIFFLDSDDYIQPDTLELLYKACVDNDSDLSICGINMFWQNNKTRKYLYPVNKTVVQSIDLCALMLSGKAFSWAWTKLYRRSLWIKHNLEFPVGRTFEDIAISFSILKVYQKIAIVNKPLYQYRMRQSSITGTISLPKIFDFIAQTQQAISTAKDVIGGNKLTYLTDQYIEAYAIIQSTQLMAMYSIAQDHGRYMTELLRKSDLAPKVSQVIRNRVLSARKKVRFFYFRFKTLCASGI